MQPASKEARSPRKRPPRAFVVWDPKPDEVDAEVDWSAWYLTDEADMGHSPEHGEVSEAFFRLTRAWMVERGRTDLRVGFDEFFAWVEGEPLVRVSPDVILHVAPPRPYPKSWATYLGHPPPLFALETVSRDWRKDYDDNPPKYAQLGCRELVIFDPEAARGVTRVPERIPLQVYRRDDDGAFVKVYAGRGPAFSERLEAWLVVQTESTAAWLRIARDPAGHDLLPYPEDRAHQEQARADHERARAEQERARAEQERVRADEQATENARLRTELERLKRS